jgi:integrase
LAKIKDLAQPTYTEPAQIEAPMTFMADTEELKTGLVIFRRKDVQHDNWYCRIKLPNTDRYKHVSLKTRNVSEARDRAFDHDAEVRFKLKHELPVFNRPFSEVAKEFAEHQKKRSQAGEITHHAWRVIDSHIKTQLNPYVGTTQVTLISQDKWNNYSMWRQSTGKGRSGGRVSDATIRSEMGTFRAIMNFAAARSYIKPSQVFKGKLPKSKAAREEFTPDEYRKLHTYARKWVKGARTRAYGTTRTIAYNFILIMCNTGMRPSEAKNLRWRDVAIQTDKEGRRFARLSVHGKGKHRNLVAPHSVAEYIERIRAVSKATEPDDYVFTNEDGSRTKTLYYGTIEGLLLESGLMLSSTGKRRSTYCFRHTYATFRLTEGVDVYFLSKQMGTSVKMIEDHYGHVNPVKNADRILQGLPGWEPQAALPVDRADGAGAGKRKARSPDKSKQP